MRLESTFRTQSSARKRSISSARIKTGAGCTHSTHVARPERSAAYSLTLYFGFHLCHTFRRPWVHHSGRGEMRTTCLFIMIGYCLLYTSDAADERSSVDLGGRRIIKKKK